MEIQYKEIPRKFLEDLPEGMKLVVRHDKKFLVVDRVFCPNGHTLIDESVNIHGVPAIRIKLHNSSVTGFIYLDSFWGSYSKLYSFIPENISSLDSFSVSCPVCDANLLIEQKCSLENCNSTKAIELTLPGNNKILVCTKLGCPGHYMDIKKMPDKVIKSISDINYFVEELNYDDFFGGV